MYETPSNTNREATKGMIHPSTILPPKPARNGMAGVALCRGFPIPADAAQGICDGIGALRGVLLERSCFADTPDLPTTPELPKKFLHKLQRTMKGRKEFLLFGSMWVRFPVSFLEH